MADDFGFTPATAVDDGIGFTPSGGADDADGAKKAKGSVSKFLGELWDQTGGQIGPTVKRVSGWDDWMKAKDQMTAGDYSGAGTTLLSMASDPGHLGSDVLATSKDQVSRAGKALKEGRYHEAALHINAAIPVIGTAFAGGMNGLDKMAEGNHAEGAADVVANLGMLALPGAVEEAAGRAAPKISASLKRAAPVVKAAVEAGSPDIAMGALKAGVGVAADYMGVPDHLATFMGVREGVPQIARGVAKGFKAGRQVITDRATPPALPVEDVPTAPVRQPGVQDPAAVEPRTPIIDTSTELTPEQEAAMAARRAGTSPQEPQAPGAPQSTSDPAARAQTAPQAPPEGGPATSTATYAGDPWFTPAETPAAAAGNVNVPPQDSPGNTAENTGPAAQQEVLPLDSVSPAAEPAIPQRADAMPAGEQPRPLDEPAYDHAVEPAAGQKPDYQAAARTVKGRGMARFLTNPPEGPAITAEEATRMTPEQWQMIAKEAGHAAKKPPSPETIAVALDHMREIEARRAQRSLGSSTDDGSAPPAPAATLPADGEANPTGQPLEAPTPGTGSEGVPVSGSPAPGVEPGASETQVEIPGEGRSLPARYAVRELADVQSSHNGLTFQKNPRYSLVNDRDYSRQENQGKVIEGSGGKFKPSFHITDNPDAVNGPPVIDSKGNAVGGNGRTMQLQRVYAYNPKGAADYRAQLVKKAQQFGIDPDQVAQMKQPVLVREIADEHLGQASHAITDLNKTGTAALTPAERAIADSRRVSPATLDHIAAKLDAAGPDTSLTKVLSSDDGPAILKRLIDDGVLSQQETAAYQSDGKLTPAAKIRIGKLMLGRFFRDPAQLDTTPAPIVAKLERLAAPVAKLEGQGAWNLTPKLQEALDLIDEARAHSTRNLSEFLKQTGLLGESRYTADAVTLGKALQRFTGRQLGAAVKDYAATAKFAAEHADAKGGLFGDQVKGEAPTPAEAFEAAFRPGKQSPTATPANPPGSSPGRAAKPKTSAERLGDQLKRGD